MQNTGDVDINAKSPSGYILIKNNGAIRPSGIYCPDKIKKRLIDVPISLLFFCGVILFDQ